MKPEQPDATRQTQSYLRHLLAQRGLQPKNKMGQNFLIDLNLLDLIVRRAELTRDDLVLEIGSGTGGLTTRLLAAAGGLVSIELDPAFAVMVRETLPITDNFILIHADALKTKNELNPEIMDALAELHKRLGTKQIKLVSNLPYAVATPVLSNLLLSDLPLERLVATVQWEIAERMVATPSTKSYGALAVLVQSLADVTIVRRMPPTVFWPQPKVDSAIVEIRPNAAKRAEVGNVLRFRHFLRDLYVHRRKNLRGALVGFPTKTFSKEEVDRKLAELGLDGTLRAEALDREQHLELCAAFV